MQKITPVILLIILASCGGDLSQRQRESIKKSIDDGQIRRMTPAQLTESGFQLGRRVSGIFKDDSNLANRNAVDSLASTAGIRVKILRPGSGSIGETIAEAYAAAPDAAELTDNLQKIGTDTLLYTKPVSYERPDGSQVFSHALGVYLPVRWVVRQSPD